ncbi:MAG: hypothetical protein K8F54_13405 [Altibacter sp.]|uniref:hypothetical protein n=1 Tax=Altibacter sp. TaxID=2024823 RepID=UPI001D712EFA|nr:hypothetical protein [Altibacter sp.]MBZ0328598.1 hypothetical protein [Altibacter sp.]
MKLLRSVFSFYINSSTHVALAVLALLQITVLEFNLEVSYSLYGFVFFGTITAYNFVKYAGVAGLHHYSLTESLKAIQVFSVFCFVLLFYFVLQQTVRTIIAASFFGLLTLFYAIPLLKKKNLRTVTGLKIFIVAMVWAGATVVVPLVASGTEFNNTELIVFVQRILLVIVLTIPFEIRDLPYDAASLLTLPQRLGIKAVKTVGYVVLLGCILLDFLKDEGILPFTISLMVFCALAGLFLFYSEKKQSRYFASFWVESLPIVWLGIVLLTIHFFM